MKKKIYFICQAKGGAGKSALTFLMAEKYKEACILDTDDATKTSTEQLAYRKPVLVSFIDPTTKRVDRAAFNELFESVMSTKRNLFLADLGASVSEELPNYVSFHTAEAVNELLTVSEIQLEILCVVGGADVFSATMKYLQKLFEACGHVLKITVVSNGYYPLLNDQEKVLIQYCTDNELPLVPFNLLTDKTDMSVRVVQQVLKAGNGLSGINPFYGIYFTKPESLQL